jgi:hypothetical protein
MLHCKRGCLKRAASFFSDINKNKIFSATAQIIQLSLTSFFKALPIN